MLHYYALLVYYININQKEDEMLAVAENKKRIMISLTEGQNRELEKLAKEKGFSKSAIVALALEEYKKGQKNA